MSATGYAAKWEEAQGTRGLSNIHSQCEEEVYSYGFQERESELEKV